MASQPHPDQVVEPETRDQYGHPVNTVSSLRESQKIEANNNRGEIHVTIAERIRPYVQAIATVTSTAGFFIFGILYIVESHQNAQEIATALRKDAVATDLNSNNFQFFMQNEWVDMKADIQTTKNLIATKCSK